MRMLEIPFEIPLEIPLEIPQAEFRRRLCQFNLSGRKWPLRHGTGPMPNLAALPPSSSGKAAGIKALVAFGHVAQDFAGLVTVATFFGKVRQSLHQLVRAQCIRVAKRAAEKRRKPETEYGADVTIAGIAQNARLQASRRLIDHM